MPRRSAIAGGGARGHSTAIYFLLEAGDVSAWHRVRDAAEVWHFYAGAPLELTLHRRQTSRSRCGDRSAPTSPAGERPQAIVPADWWQTARSLGDWTLVGCTVAPGFDFSSFELAPPGWQPDGLTLRLRQPPRACAEQQPLGGQHGAARDQQAGKQDARLGSAKPATIRIKVDSSGAA